MKQTAVEWLENEFQEMCKDFGGVHLDFIVKFEQAKAMEKEQIIEAFKGSRKTKSECNYWNCSGDEKFYESAEDYYNETFKSE